VAFLFIKQIENSIKSTSDVKAQNGINFIAKELKWQKTFFLRRFII